MIHVCHDIRTIPTERRDCGVKAIATIMDVSYEEAHRALRACGRRSGTGTTRKVLHRGIKAVAASYGAVAILHPVARSGSFGKFLRTHPKGRFIVETGYHYTSVIDGRIWDWSADPEKLWGRCRVAGAWQIQVLPA